MTQPASDDAQEPLEVSLREAEEGLQLEPLQEHQLIVDPGFMFSS